MKFLNILKTSIAAKTTFLVLMIVIAILLVAGIWQMQYVRNILANETYFQSNRAMESAIKVIDQRIARAEYEMSQAANFDCIVVNDRLEVAEQDALRLVETFVNSNE